MLTFLKKIFGGKRYNTQKEKLQSGDAVVLRELASDSGTHPEILYFLAGNEDAGVRQAVATNASTPLQAASKLAQDQSVDVRQALAARLLVLMPGLSPDRQSQLYAFAVQALGMLAQDEVFSIRRALSSTLRDYAKAPPAVVSRLARDVEKEVSEPILRFCVALPDDDLLDILAAHPEPWVISAVASRPTVSPRLSDAVVDTNDVPATTVLVNNAGAALSPVTLQKIIDRAKDHPEWHRPVSLRPELSFDFARQLAGFIDEAVLVVLEKRGDFDPATRQGIAGIVKRRLDYLRKDKPNETAEEKIKRLTASKSLTPDVVQDALAWHDDEFVLMSLSVMSEVHPQIVKKMIGLGTAKPVVALCWKAKLPMRLCTELQLKIAKIDPKEALYAKGGTDYPMTQADIKWQLEFFGIKE